MCVCVQCVRVHACVVWGGVYCVTIIILPIVLLIRFTNAVLDIIVNIVLLTNYKAYMFLTLISVLFIRCSFSGDRTPFAGMCYLQ